MGRSEAQARQFVMLGRPSAFVVSFAGFGIAALLSDAPELDVFLAVLAAAFFLTQVPGWLAMSRGIEPMTVARSILLVDIPMVASLTWALDSENLLAIPYFAPIAFAALMFGARFTLTLTALASVGVAVVGIAFVEAGAITILADLVVLVVTGGILSGLSGEMHKALEQLAQGRRSDAAALHVAERIGFPQTLTDVLQPSVEELGRATGASRCLLRLRPRPDGSAPIYEWDRPGAPLAGAASPPPFIRQVFETGSGRVIHDTRKAEPELRDWAAPLSAISIVAWPVTWRGQVVAVLGFTDDRVRDWETDGLPLIRQVAPIVGAALAQAETFEQMQRVSLLRQELVARVSHELRTPLTSTIGFLQTLERSDLRIDEKEREWFLQIARSEAERLAVLVDDLLDLARLERGAVSLQVDRVELRGLAERAMLGLEPGEGQRIVIEVEDGITIRADPHRLLQVLSNLLGNALRHGSGDVLVTSERLGDNVEISVSDEGAGVADEHVAQLFEPFSRGSDEAGTGLGLAIARAIVEAHGGALVYRSAENGRPHAFVIVLPQERELSAV